MHFGCNGQKTFNIDEIVLGIMLASEIHSSSPIKQFKVVTVLHRRSHSGRQIIFSKEVEMILRIPTSYNNQKPHTLNRRRNFSSGLNGQRRVSPLINEYTVHHPNFRKVTSETALRKCVPPYGKSLQNT